MQKHVKYNIEGHRLLDTVDEVTRVCEDVSEFTPPTIEFNTASIENISGMGINVDLPNQSVLKQMECKVNHNNGVNCRYLTTPGVHMLEFRAVRQDYGVADVEIGHESIKMRVQCMFKSEDKETLKIGDPYSSNVTFAVLGYEEEIAGEIVTSFGIGRDTIINGKNCTSTIDSLLE